MVGTWKIVLASLLIFAAGVLTGRLTVGASFRTPRAHAVARTTPGSPRAGSTNFPGTNVATGILRGGTNRLSGAPHAVQRLEAFRRASRQLDLDPAHRARVDGLVAESTERLRVLWSPVAPLLQQEVKDLRKRIAEELTPEQRERFDALLDKRAAPVPTNSAATGAP